MRVLVAPVVTLADAADAEHPANAGTGAATNTVAEYVLHAPGFAAKHTLTEYDWEVAAADSDTVLVVTEPVAEETGAAQE